MAPRCVAINATSVFATKMAAASNGHGHASAGMTWETSRDAYQTEMKAIQQPDWSVALDHGLWCSSRRAEDRRVVLNQCEGAYQED